MGHYFLDRWYIYMYMNTYTYTNIYKYIFTCYNLKFYDNIFIEDAMPEKALKFALFKKNLRPKSSFLNIFQNFLQK